MQNWNYSNVDDFKWKNDINFIKFSAYLYFISFEMYHWKGFILQEKIFQ